MKAREMARPYALRDSVLRPPGLHVVDAPESRGPDADHDLK